MALWQITFLHFMKLLSVVFLEHILVFVVTYYTKIVKCELPLHMYWQHHSCLSCYSISLSKWSQINWKMTLKLIWLFRGFLIEMHRQLLFDFEWFMEPVAHSIISAAPLLRAQAADGPQRLLAPLAKLSLRFLSATQWPLAWTNIQSQSE